jgi:hypothetical protein
MKTCSAIVSATMLAAVSSASAAIVASDNGSNYGSGWTNGSNGGTGFGAWSFATQGGGYKGAFVGDPSNIGVTGMGSTALALYANGGGNPGIFALRSFSNALGVGDSFSLQWGINWDSGTGQKSIMVYTGSGFLIPALQVSNQGSASISVLAATSGLVSDIGFGYGTNAMTWTFTQTTATSVTVTANDRDGSGSYSQTFAVNGPLTGFGMLANGFSDGSGNREPYYNNFTINAVPAPGALALLGVAGLVGARRRR